MKNVELLYHKMDRLGLLRIQSKKLSSGSYMDLSVERIGTILAESFELSMTHYGEQNGDLMRDPEVVVTVYPKYKVAYAHYYRNDYVGVEQEAYSREDPTMVKTKMRKQITNFALMWMKNLKNQGFTNNPPEDVTQTTGEVAPIPGTITPRT